MYRERSLHKYKWASALLLFLFGSFILACDFRIKTYCERQRERDRIEEREGVPERHKYLEKHTLKTHRQREKTHLHHWTQHTNKNPESINSFNPKFHFLLFIYSLIFLLFFTSLKKKQQRKKQRGKEKQREILSSYNAHFVRDKVISITKNSANFFHFFFSENSLIFSLTPRIEFF